MSLLNEFNVQWVTGVSLYLLVNGISVTYSIFDKYCLMLVDFLSACH